VGVVSFSIKWVVGIHRKIAGPNILFFAIAGVATSTGAFYTTHALVCFIFYITFMYFDGVFFKLH